MEKVTFHIISHTHWDREWYLPFEVFRIELVELIDNLLNILEQNPDFIFHLDGQSIILKDYLEIRPYKKDQIQKFVKSGNLLIGPWYVLSDQFLTSGEATIRNLLYGLRDSLNFGCVMSVGYLPDQFGQIAQLPQVFKGFNITSVVLGRGIQDSIAEHNWYGLNGDSVLAISLTHWYDNAKHIPSKSEDLHMYLEKIYLTQKDTSYSSHILLMNGCDHLFPQKELLEVIKQANKNSKWDLLQSTLPKAMELISKSDRHEFYPMYFGELRDDNNKYILAGTLSSRVYLKLENYKCQTKLEKIIEPLSTLVAINKKCIYPQDEIKYAWRLLIQNHAHDSICGCSIDDVHREMEIRFLKVRQILDKLQENLLSHLSCTGIDNNYLQLINLTPYKRSETIETEIEIPLGPPAEHPSSSPTITRDSIKNLQIKRFNELIDFEILESRNTFKMVRSKNEVPLLQAIQRFRLLFNVDLEPFSIATYEINSVETPRRGVSIGHITKNDFENKFYKLEINIDGAFSIILKENNYEFKNIHFITIEDDLGDEYNFVPGDAGGNHQLTKWQIKTIEENKFRKRFLLTINEMSDLNIEVEVTCYQNTKRIDFKTKIDNNLKNKRIRLHFPTGLETNYIFADTPFGILRRSRPSVSWINYATTQPLHNWISHTNGKVGFAFLGGGLAEYELYEDGNGYAVTLIRAVGKLTSVKSHSLIETPDAQCNRAIEFSYAIFPHAEEIDLTKESLIFQTPVVYNQSTSTLQIESLFSISDGLVVSTLKRSEDNKNLYILRLFNPLNKTLEDLYVTLNFPFKKILKLNLNEEILSKIEIDKNQINFKSDPFEIITFGIEV